MLSVSRRSGWCSPCPSVGGEPSLTYWGKGKGYGPGGFQSRNGGWEAFGHSTSSPECASYFENGANSTDTGSDWEDLAESEEMQAYLGSFEGCTAQGLREDYFLARARYRHFTGKASRSRRFPRRAKGTRKGGKGGRKSFERAWMIGGESSLTSSFEGSGSALGASAFACGKGKGGNPMGKGKERNPMDPSGRQRECFRRGSRDHLTQDCRVPKGKGEGGGGGKKGKFYGESPGFWNLNQSAVDGATDYHGFTTDTKPFLTITSGEQFPIDSGGERVATEHSEYPIWWEYESDWLSSKVVSHHQPAEQSIVESGSVTCGLERKVVSHHQPAAWSRSITYTTPRLLRECGRELRGACSPSRRKEESDTDDETGDAVTATSRSARLADRHRVVVGRPSGFPKPKPKPKKEAWKSVLPAERTSEGWFPTDIETAYLASVRLPHGTSLLVDTGSPGNIVSDGWSEDHAIELQRAGLPNPYYTERTTPMICFGIGHGTQEAGWDVNHPICLGTSRLDNYTAPELPNAKTPALLGQRSMKKLRTFIDTFTGKMFLVGPGGYEIRLSPGSEVHSLEESPAGHLMLPCSRFGSQAAQPNSESQTFMVGDYFETQSFDPSARSVKNRAPVDVAVADMLKSLDMLAETGLSS